MKKSVFKLLIILFTGIMFAFISFLISESNNYSTTELVKAAEEKLAIKEKLAKKQLDLFSASLQKLPSKTIFSKYNSSISEFYHKEGISIYAYHNDSLCFWTDNEPAIDLYLYTNVTNVQLIKIRNGWYEFIRQTDTLSPNYTCVALILIKPDYDFENKYLKNNFSSWLNLPDNAQLVTPISYLPHAVKSSFGTPLFEVYRSDGLYKDKILNTYACLFAVVACLLFLATFYLFLKLFIKKNVLIYFSILCLLIRTVMIYFKVPHVFYYSDLYNATIFANASSFYFSYLGDVLINTGVVFLIAIFIYKSKYKIVLKTNFAKCIALIAFIVFIAFFTIQIKNLVYSLVNNSTISYNINNLFGFSAYSLIGILSVGLMLFAFYLFIEKIVLIALNSNFSVILYLIFIGTVIIFYFILDYFKIKPYEFLWPIILIAISYFLRRYKATYNFINIGLIVLVSTFVASTLFNNYEQLNKEQTYQALSLNLTDRQDVIAENEFGKVSESIKKDSKIKNLLSFLPLSTLQIQQSLRQINFSGYFERYDIVISLFNNDGTPVFEDLDPIYLNEDYFKQQIHNDGFQTVSDDLYFIDKEKKSIRYIAKINIDDTTKNQDLDFRLYLQLEPKIATNIGVFPDLLLGKSYENKLESKQLSYAVYDFNKLFTMYGEYQYPLFIDDTVFKKSTNDGYQHFLYSNKKNSNIIITEKDFGIWGKFTSNSYLFIFFSCFVLISFWINTIINKRNNRFKSLNNRIQFILVSVVVLSLTGVVIGTIWVVTSQSELKNQKELILKSQSVLKELQQSVGTQQTLNQNYKDNTSYQLKQLSQLFGSDISLFNTKGILYATSQPAIYDQGLISKFMHPNAYKSFITQTRANFTHKENIGSLKYLSAYLPFYNTNDKLLGYINLPYFSRQKDLEKELTAYLTTLINIYTLLFALTTLVALLVSNLLTKPLRIIKQKISNIQFGKHNEALHWNANDEIGNLISEYNNMLIKLEVSSELLAKSERESAWREMAKQVAHEIKNPLTPMKLNIQHLQRVVETHPADINERVKRVSQMLIEQIDTLSHIATEFSNFAKFPKATLEVINLFDVLQNVTHLFQQNTACQINLNATQNLFIMADKEQCLRIFTNLLKNAEQSIPYNRSGNIDIVAYAEQNLVTVTVKDNGLGIDDNVKDKLFTPNFTTKSTGNGLGLAMVKNAVVSFNGSINFETEVNKGSTFILQFPLVINT